MIPCLCRTVPLYPSIIALTLAGKSTLALSRLVPYNALKRQSKQDALCQI